MKDEDVLYCENRDLTPREYGRASVRLIIISIVILVSIPLLPKLGFEEWLGIGLLILTVILMTLFFGIFHARVRIIVTKEKISVDVLGGLGSTPGLIEFWIARAVGCTIIELPLTKVARVERSGRQVPAVIGGNRMFIIVLHTNGKSISVPTTRPEDLCSIIQKIVGSSGYNNALEIEPQDAAAWSNKGKTLFSLGRHQKAIDCYNKALEIDPRYVAAWSNKGGILLLLGRHQEAIDCCNKALEINPRDAAAWYDKALAEERLGRTQEAVRSYRRFIECASTKDAQLISYARKRVQELEQR